MRYLLVIEHPPDPPDPPRPRSRRAIPAPVIDATPRPQRPRLRKAVKALGGWDAAVACGETARKPRKTWPSTKKFSRQIEDEAGLDLSAIDPAPMRDPFCEPLELTGSQCPDARVRGGWLKALRIGMGSKDRRLADLRARPQWQALTAALAEQGVTLTPPAAAIAAELRNAEIGECKAQHADRRAEAVSAAKRPAPPTAAKPRAKRGPVPF